jgi:oxygen-independent coproporphyrinogen III oxidase
MAGIYIHIPFCRQKCYYCDFYSSTEINLSGKFITALKKEITLRRNYLGGEIIDTIYFGGGTPSVLSINQLNEILSFLKVCFYVSGNAEITLEANPDDLNMDYLKGLLGCGINRLSIGVQSLQERHLKRMNRRHDAMQSVSSVMNAAGAGFTNISVDLIYGLPDLSGRQWKSDLHVVLNMPVVHLSAYHLTYHKGTVFYKWLQGGKIKELPERESVSQFRILIEETGRAGFEQYEISNFAKDGIYSVHNRAYWTGKKYLGTGPAAHSYDGKTRRWNTANLEKYIRAVENNERYYGTERLGPEKRYNEYILTNLRTKWGVSAVILEKHFGREKLDFFLRSAEKYISLEKIIRINDIFLLSKEGIFTSDNIIADLMII